MSALTPRQFSEMHLMNRMWANELELARLEVDFWEDLLGTVGEFTDPAICAGERWQHERGQLGYFRRLATQLQGEIDALHSELTEDVRTHQKMDTETRLDGRYLRLEMERFHTDFLAFKARFRPYLVSLSAF